MHDYFSERGGAERVAIALAGLFPNAPIYTSVYDSVRYPEFADREVHASILNQVRPLRRWYRVGMPLLPLAFDRMTIEADVVLCSSSGWAHGVRTSAPKVVYCYNPARWLYQREDYVKQRRRYLVAATAFSPVLKRWDQNAAKGCVRYLAISNVVANRIQQIYGREAEVLPPPVTLDPGGMQTEVEGLEPGFVLSVGRLQGYKNVDEVVAAFGLLPDRRLVVVGDGPHRARLEQDAPKNVTFLGRVSEAQLRWCYANCSALVSASYEDFGLTPVEAALFGKPSVLLRAGGFLDTTVEEVTGHFFEDVNPWAISGAIRQTLKTKWSTSEIRANGDRYSLVGFGNRLQQIMTECSNESS